MSACRISAARLPTARRSCDVAASRSFPRKRESRAKNWVLRCSLSPEGTGTSGERTRGGVMVDFFIDLVIIGLSVGMVCALVALGISLIFSGLDIVHFAHGEIYMIGAFIGLTLFQQLGLPYVPTLLLAVVLTGLVGVLIERVFYRRLTSKGGGYTVAGMGMVIVGFGMSIVLQNVAFLIWGPKPLPFPVPFGRPIEVGNLTLPMSYVWIVVTAFVLMIGLHLMLRKTMWE